MLEDYAGGSGRETFAVATIVIWEGGEEGAGFAGGHFYFLSNSVMWNVKLSVNLCWSFSVKVFLNSRSCFGLPSEVCFDTSSAESVISFAATPDMQSKWAQRIIVDSPAFRFSYARENVERESRVIFIRSSMYFPIRSLVRVFWWMGRFM